MTRFWLIFLARGNNVARELARARLVVRLQKLGSARAQNFRLVTTSTWYKLVHASNFASGKIDKDFQEVTQPFCFPDYVLSHLKKKTIVLLLRLGLCQK